MAVGIPRSLRNYKLFSLVGVAVMSSLALAHWSRRIEANRNLIAAVKVNDTLGALNALRAGADPNVHDRSADESTSLIEKVRLLRDRALHPDQKEENINDLTPLLLCLRDGKQDDPVLVKALLDSGAEPDISDCYGNTPLLWALVRHDGLSTRLLLQHHANVNAKCADAQTALHFAASHGNVDDVRLLIKYGANVNAQDKLHFESPLIAALVYRRFDARNADIISALIENHADVNLTNVNGKTALDYAKQRPWKQIVKLLSEHGARTAPELNPSRGH